MSAHASRLPVWLDPLIAEAKRRMRRRRFLAVALLALLVGAGLGIAFAVRSPSGGQSGPPGNVGAAVVFEHRSAAHAMASVFAHPSSGPVPAGIARFAASLVRGAPPGTPDLPRGVLVDRGRLLLSNLGPAHRAIYAFPTRNGEVCFVISGHGPARARGGLGAGCMKAFNAGEPASVDGGSLYFPATSGPPTELAGLTEDGVTRVQIVLDGTLRDAVFANDAWYFRFPSSHVPATAATKLLVSLANGRTATVPLRISAPAVGK
jgi:hypothetical protein